MVVTVVVVGVVVPPPPRRSPPRCRRCHRPLPVAPPFHPVSSCLRRQLGVLSSCGRCGHRGCGRRGGVVMVVIHSVELNKKKPLAFTRGVRLVMGPLGLHPVIHPTSSCSQQWWGLALLLSSPWLIVVIPLAIHPASTARRRGAGAGCTAPSGSSWGGW